ncbi:MAG: recombinase RecA [Clostridia bacterium]|nr:recombinase RecA [Clostridia bacterium]
MATKSKKAEVVSALEQQDEKNKALETAIAQIKKAKGAGSIMRLGDNAKMNVQAISSGSLTLDLALGIGGVPRGRIVEIYGPESSGKTTVALHIIAEAQKTGGNAAFIDAEHALDPNYAKALGVDTDRLLVSQPDCGEDALEIADALVRSGALDVCVIDSVAALVPQQEIDGDMGANHVGLQARLMSQALRKLAGAISKTNCIVIFINQLREKVGVMYGNPEVTTGGKALKFYASVRLDVRKTENLKNGDEVYGNHVKVKVVKNKVAPPFRVAEFDILYGKGISKSSEIIEIATALDIIQKSGSWFSYNGERIGQGKENARKFLEEHPDLMADVENRVREQSKNATVVEDGDYDADDEDDTLSLNDEGEGITLTGGMGMESDEDDDETGHYSLKISDIDGE